MSFFAEGSGLGWQIIVELLLLGSITGYLAGLLGIGGGMLMVPFVTLLLSSKSVPPHEAQRIPGGSRAAASRSYQASALSFSKRSATRRQRSARITALPQPLQ